MSDNIDYSKAMLKLRKRAGLTQREVAIAIGITDQTVSNWENNIRKPQLTPRQWYDLMKVFKCTPEELAGIGGDESDRPPNPKKR
jgi:transcriptional regulator with XRE-family HTH domain